MFATKPAAPREVYVIDIKEKTPIGVYIYIIAGYSLSYNIMILGVSSNGPVMLSLASFAGNFPPAKLAKKEGTFFLIVSFQVLTYLLNTVWNNGD